MQAKSKSISKTIGGTTVSKTVSVHAKVEKPKTAALKVHPATANFPDLSDAEFEALKEDIRINGLLQPILTKDNQIVDGRQRYRACIELGIQPMFIEISENTTPEQSMVSHNLLRRHLNESQRAMIGSRLVTTRLGSNQSTAETVSQPTAAAMLGVSTDSIQRATKLLNFGDQALMKVVESGKLTVHEAVLLSKLPVKLLKPVLEASNDGDFKFKVKAARDQVREVELGKIRADVAAMRSNNKPIDTVAGQFGVLYIDPPWSYIPEAETGYPTMSREQLMELDVKSKAQENAVCFMWVPASQLALALELMQVWGFEYKTHAIWDKESPTTGSYFHSRHELLLLGTRGTLPEVDPKCRHQSIFAEKRNKQHSRKPKAAYVLIEQMYPELTKLELFCRGKAREGWAVWGNEAISNEAPIATAIEKQPAKRKSLSKDIAANETNFTIAA